METAIVYWQELLRYSHRETGKNCEAPLSAYSAAWRR